jgi:hypothetical protein
MPATSFDWSADLIEYLYLHRQIRHDEVFQDNSFGHKGQRAKRFDRILSRKIYPPASNTVVANWHWL